MTEIFIDIENTLIDQPPTGVKTREFGETRTHS